jgi:hypothetical protein
MRSRSRLALLEHRPHLVAAARELARAFGVDDRVTFVHGALDPATLPAADVYYLFNPFGETSRRTTSTSTRPSSPATRVTHATSRRW